MQTGTTITWSDGCPQETMPRPWYLRYASRTITDIFHSVSGIDGCMEREMNLIMWSLGFIIMVYKVRMTTLQPSSTKYISFASLPNESRDFWTTEQKLCRPQVIHNNLVMNSVHTLGVPNRHIQWFRVFTLVFTSHSNGWCKEWKIHYKMAIVDRVDTIMLLDIKFGFCEGQIWRVSY